MQTPAPFAMEPTLVALQGALPNLEEGRFPPFPGDGGRRHAAVSLVLRKGPELEALLIQRAEAEGDPWSGHMALPGGRRDFSDPDILHTALRETLEETGVALDRIGVPLGFLDPLMPATRRLPPLSIYPFVFAVPPETRARPTSSEVARVFWTPLRKIFSPQAAGTVRIPLEDAARDFPCIRVGGQVIWGLTYRILRDFLRRLEEHAPEVLEHPGSLFG